MLKNYFRIAWRNLVKSRFYALVNIAGLSAGLVLTLLIGAYVWSELQFDKHISNLHDQYLIQSHWKDPNQGIEITSLGPLAKSLKEQYPNLVANYFRWDGITSGVSKGDKSFREGLMICDSTFLSMFGFKLAYGDIHTALHEPYSVVITEEKARKYFGKTDVLGETLTMESFGGTRHDFRITGVLSKPPKNSITFINDENDNQIYVSAENLAFFNRSMDWNNRYIVSYIQLQPGVNPARLQIPMQRIISQNTNADIATNLKPYLSPLRSFHLSSNNGLIQKMLYALSAIALFILLMAMVNFVNLSVSRSAGRMREIGIRKVMGGLRKQLILQFLIESLVLVMGATLIAFIMYALVREWFGTILQTDIPALSEFPLYFIMLPLVLILLISILAGIYPAFILSAVEPVQSLKGKRTVKENVGLRKSLVAFQFGTATIALAGAIIISQQMRLFFSKDLGYNKDYVVSIGVPRDWSANGVRHMETIRQQFASLPQVAATSLAYTVPDGNSAGVFALYRTGNDSTQAIQSQSIFTDENYKTTFNIPMSAGEFFGTPGNVTDSSRIVINESLSKALGFNNPEEALGQQLKSSGGDRLFTIAGVTRDFHFGGMQAPIQPLVFYNLNAFTVFRVLCIKLKPGYIPASISALQKKWNQLLPGAPFGYTFMDDTLKRLYKTEIQLQKAAYVATSLSLIIVLLGILGLVSVSVEKRTREIGIRKVLGSTVKGILALFLKEIIIVVLLAGLVACPIAYVIMNKWLGDYAYRIHLTALPFLTAMAVLALFTVLMVVAQTLKTAMENPVKSLRAE